MSAERWGVRLCPGGGPAGYLARLNSTAAVRVFDCYRDAWYAATGYAAEMLPRPVRLKPKKKKKPERRVFEGRTMSAQSSGPVAIGTGSCGDGPYVDLKKMLEWVPRCTRVRISVERVKP